MRQPFGEIKSHPILHSGCIVLEIVGVFFGAGVAISGLPRDLAFFTGDNSVAAILVWIDRDHARLITYSPPSGSRSSEERLNRGNHHHGQFMTALIERLEMASKILIVGPGVAKYRLYAHLRETYSSISKKVVACEELENVQDAHLKSLAEKHLGVRLS